MEINGVELCEFYRRQWLRDLVRSSSDELDRLLETNSEDTEDYTIMLKVRKYALKELNKL
jgi:hypothetical protein